MLQKSFINTQLGIKFESYIDQNLNVWFKAKDVAKILGYKDTTQAIRKNASIEDKYKGGVQTTGGLQNCVFLNESGLYSLVLSSKLETARKFKRWITSEVLPSIRKYSYFKMFDSRIKQRVIIDGVKYYKHQVFSRYAVNKNGEVINLKTKRIMKMTKNNSGYLYFSIYDKKLENHVKYSNHRFVYEVFKGPIPKCFEVDHINNIKLDNRVKNLQLLTPKQNRQKSSSKPIISTCIETGEERIYNSIKIASIELDIHFSCISSICIKRKHHKTAKSKKDKKNTHLDT